MKVVQVLLVALAACVVVGEEITKARLEVREAFYLPSFILCRVVLCRPVVDDV